MTIYSKTISDDGELTVCGSLWPGWQDGAPAPDWFLDGTGVSVKDLRTKPAGGEGGESDD